MLKSGTSFADIAKYYGIPEEDVIHDLQVIRTKHAEPKRKSLNVDPDVAAVLQDEALSGEAMKETVRRVVDELKARRLSHGSV